MKTTNNLAKRLLYLPLDINEKVFLWLTYKGLKPVSEIMITRRKNKKSNPVALKKWIEDAGLTFKPEPDIETCWHVGKNEEDILTSIKVLRKFDFENEVLSGKLFGFPEKSARAYASNRNDISTPIVWYGEKYTNEYLKDKYYTPYILFSLSAEDVEEDSQVAKKWADTIRNDVPKLAKWFEDKERP